MPKKLKDYEAGDEITAELCKMEYVVVDDRVYAHAVRIITDTKNGMSLDELNAQRAGSLKRIEAIQNQVIEIDARIAALMESKVPVAP